MKKVKILVCLALVLSLALCLAACGKDSSSGSSIAGKYELVSMEADGEKATKADLEAMFGMEIDFYVQLNSDGTGVFNMMGETEEMEYANGEIWAVSEPESKVPFTVKGNTLTLTMDGSTMTFKK